MNKQTFRTVRSIVSILIIVMYFAGIVLMFLNRFQQGLILWFFSTLIGALLLYVKHTRDKKEAALKEMQEKEGASEKDANA